MNTSSLVFPRQARRRGLLCLTSGLLFAAGQSAEPVAARLPQGPPVTAEMEFAQLANIKVTSVSRTESTVAHSPAAIFVITPEMIQRSGATAIPELFRMVPGMNVARLDGNKWAVGVRGFNDRFSNKLLVQVDGRTVYNPSFSGVFWDTVDYPLEDIERIEVIRGPGASVWGANAVNGVINVITKPAQDTQGGLVSAGGGTEERGFGTFRYGGKLADDLHYRVYGKGFNRDKQFSQQGDPNDAWWGASGGLRLDWQPDEQNSFTFDGSYLRSEAGRKDQHPTLLGPSFISIDPEDEITDAAHVLGRWTRTLNTDSSWSLQAYWDRLERSSTAGITHLRFDTFDLDFQQQFPLGERQKLVYGAGYRFIDAFQGDSSTDGGFVVSYDRNNRQLQLFSVFVQDEIAVVKDKVSLMLGSKFEHNDFTGFEVQPSARLLWTPTKRQSVWAAVSRAVRTPGLGTDELSLTLFPAATSPVAVYPRLLPDRGAKSDELLAYELGYRAQVRDDLSVDLAVFYNEYDKLTVTTAGALEPGPQPRTFIVPLTRANAMDGETYGVEVAAKWQISEWWRLYGAYSFLRMTLHNGGSSEAVEGQSPRNQVHLQSSWNLGRSVEFDLFGRYVDQLSGFNPGGAGGVSDTVDAYVSLDARLAWRPRKNLMLEVVGQNLLDHHHPEFGTSRFLRSPLVESRRGVYGKVTWTF